MVDGQGSDYISPRRIADVKVYDDFTLMLNLRVAFATQLTSSCINISGLGYSLYIVMTFSENDIIFS